MSEERGPGPGRGVAVLDRAHLARQTMDDPGLAADLLSMLLAQVESLPAALDRADRDGRTALAHRLAGAAGNLGALRLEAAARALASGGGEAAAARLLSEAAVLAAALREGGTTSPAVDEGGREP